MTKVGLWFLCMGGRFPCMVKTCQEPPPGFAGREGVSMDATHIAYTLNTCTILRLSISECISIFQVTAYYVKGLEKDKSSLEKQIRDMEWRLDQESKVPHFGKTEWKGLLVLKLWILRLNIEHFYAEWFILQAYHKANEERKQFLLEIKGAGVQIGEAKLRRGRGQDDRLTPRGYVRLSFLRPIDRGDNRTLKIWEIKWSLVELPQ